MKITLSEEALALFWDDYPRSFGIDAYIEARYSAPTTALFAEDDAEALRAA